MRWLLHGPLTAAVSDSLREHGHTPVAAAAAGVAPEASAAEVFKAAHTRQLDVMTADSALATAPFGGEPVKFERSIVLLLVAGGDVEQADAVDRLFERYKRLSPGRLYTVTNSRVKIRQLPGAR